MWRLQASQLEPASLTGGLLRPGAYSDNGFVSMTACYIQPPDAQRPVARCRAGSRVKRVPPPLPGIRQPRDGYLSIRSSTTGVLSGEGLSSVPAGVRWWKTGLSNGP